MRLSFISFAFCLLYLLALTARWLPVTGVASAGLPGLRVFALLLLSWTFYAWHVPWYIVLILFSTLVDYTAGRLLAATPPAQAHRRRTLLAGSLVANLGLLAYFKYAGFMVSGFNSVTDSAFSVPQIMLPIGISFYTFQSMSYTIDVYRREIEPERSFLRFACYISFFPQLVAGPIVRASRFLYQFNRRRRFHRRVFVEGGYLILRGLFLKMVVADNLGRIIDQYWDQAAAEPHGALALTLLIFFACQLLCDFAGYVDIARGAAYQLGFCLPVNFNAPYLATSFSEFWRRWHITLSQWIRDYLYKPLGGSRKGTGRAYVNLILVMLISGLWHGAAWTFVIWGGALGLALAVERLLGIGLRARPVAAVIAWFLVVQLTWVLSMGLFRASSLEQGLAIINHALVGLVDIFFDGYTVTMGADLVQLGWWLTLPVWLLHARVWLTEHSRLGRPSPVERSAYAGAMLAGLLMMYSTGQQFIYFQF
ncbi:MAG: alginate O-acetyltransferase complex protein AlgI [Halieaceae bacterium]